MKKIILTLGMITASYYIQAQEIKKELESLENTASSDVKSEVKTEENKGLQTALADLVKGINPSSLSSSSAEKDLLSKLGTANNSAGYGSVLSSLAGSLKSSSFESGWSKIKAGFSGKANTAKSPSEVAVLAKQLVGNLKPAAFTSGFNKTGLLNALSLVK